MKSTTDIDVIDLAIIDTLVKRALTARDVAAELSEPVADVYRRLMSLAQRRLVKVGCGDSPEPLFVARRSAPPARPCAHVECEPAGETHDARFQIHLEHRNCTACGTTLSRPLPGHFEV